ncbi:glucose-1-phosphate adenylyltransferase [Litorilinea aerophila]|uniref:Glucose-1-phosphate adenylyltransferase n=1 Tax=Litorilinea aerophila TaxID=1204385 RepID=A0A540VDR9_9CHLR|nr:glucose-1-phosphate adenylyltransferase [Litorilinea aerophila]MCC9077423.1 glucose-1-phosphate adenylyltransferase [Litorilinea aerophila]GIV80043.1 MAG: glucose-1-phosphate adenylyltransferase [Litorilinea sp.]
MKTIAMILAGGEGTRLTVLSEARAKPAVPFAGKFRIIDFPLSNCVNSGIYTVGVLTQYRPHSLNEHIGIGKPWDLDRSRGGVRLLQPYQRRRGQQWYAGTADAIYQNMDYIWEHRADTVLILSGDHIYKMNYMPMIEYHWAVGADLTIAVMPVPIEEAHRFGIMQTDDEQRIIQFYEKPKERDKGNLASMGIYVFNAHTLERRLSEGGPENPRIDFGKDVIPAMIAEGDRVFAYRYEGYWVDVGTVDSYWATNLDLLKPEPALDLYTDKWPIHTKSEERPAAKFGPQSKVVSSMISNGCVIRGLVVNSVLSPGVYVSPGAVVKDSVVMNDTWIGPGARLEKVVVDKQVMIGAGAVVGTGDESVPNEQMPDKLYTGISVIGKGAYIPDGAQIGRNVLINSNRDEKDFPADGIVADGKTI